MSTLAFRWAIFWAMFMQVLGGAIVGGRQVDMQPRDTINLAAGIPTDSRCPYGIASGNQKALCFLVNQALGTPGCLTSTCTCNADTATTIENCYSCQLVVTNASPANITTAQAFMDTYVNQCKTAGLPIQQLHVNLNVTIQTTSGASRPMSPKSFIFGLGLLWMVLALTS